MPLVELLHTMDIKTIREKILTDDVFIGQEIESLMVYYQLKHTHRWAHQRTQDETESVAEHIYGMHILCNYFAPLLEEPIDLAAVHELITWHDMAEALVGDMTSRTKTDAHKQAEKQAEEKLIASAPKHLQETLQNVYNSFDAKSTREARFVKALDKVEPMFHLNFLAGKENNLHEKFDLGWTSDVYREYRTQHVNEFDLIRRFDDILYEATKQFHPAN